MDREKIIRSFDMAFKFPGAETLFWHIFGKRFVAGETIEKGLLKTNKLMDQGYSVTLAYAGGEHTQSEAELSHIVCKHKEMIRKAAATGYKYEIALKPSSFMVPPSGIHPKFFGEKTNEEIHKVVESAEKNGILIWVDAENFNYRGPTGDLVADLLTVYGHQNVGIAIQSCFKDCEKFYTNLAWEISARTGFKRALPALRICKGGCYFEKHDIIENEEKKIASNFLQLFLYISDMSAKLRPCKIQFATHDNKLIEVVETLKKHRRPEMEYGFLYGRHKARSIRELEKKNIYCLVGPRANDRKYLVRRVIEKPSYLLFPFKR